MRTIYRLRRKIAEAEVGLCLQKRSTSEPKVIIYSYTKRATYNALH